MKKKTYKTLYNFIVAQALGDAFGYIVEFKTVDGIKSLYGNYGLSYPPLQKLACSDDTQMTLFCLNGLIDSCKENISNPTHQIYKNYLDWYNTQTKFFDSSIVQNNFLMKQEVMFQRMAPGNTCLSALSVKKPGSIENKINDSKGTGGLMRTGPIGFFAKTTEEAFYWGNSQAALTHSHYNGYLTAGFYSALVYLMVNLSKSLFEAINIAEEELDKYKNSKELLDIIHTVKWKIKDEPGYSGEDINRNFGDGWIAEEALAIAIYCAATSYSFKEVIEKATNHNGDSDTTAMLATGLWYLDNLEKDAQFIKDDKNLDLNSVIKQLFDKNETFVVDKEE